MISRLGWFEIPTAEFDRAKRFYESIFDEKLEVLDLENFKMGIFKSETIGGAICWAPQWYKPSADGTLVYLSAGADLSIVEGRIEAAGGKVIQSKKFIAPGRGYMCLFMDTEGNRLALHSER